MPRDPIPEELRRFILTSVPSVPFVEAMLIFREAKGVPITIDQLAQRLYMGEKAAVDIVAQLRETRVVEPSEGGAGNRYAPPPELSAMLDMLANYYRSNLVEVTDMIHSRKARVAHQFADAFKLRKDS